MHIRKLLVLVLLGLSLSAAADFTTITEVYEVDLTDLRLPGTGGGTLTFKQCDDCDAQTLRVSGAARYVLNDRGFALAEFKKELKRVRNRKGVAVAVTHHLKSDTITAVMVSY